MKLNKEHIFTHFGPVQATTCTNTASNQPNSRPGISPLVFPDYAMVIPFVVAWGESLAIFLRFWHFVRRIRCDLSLWSCFIENRKPFGWSQCNRKFSGISGRARKYPSYAGKPRRVAIYLWTTSWNKVGKRFWQILLTAQPRENQQ